MPKTSSTYQPIFLAQGNPENSVELLSGVSQLLALPRSAPTLNLIQVFLCLPWLCSRRNMAIKQGIVNSRNYIPYFFPPGLRKLLIQEAGLPSTFCLPVLQHFLLAIYSGLVPSLPEQSLQCWQSSLPRSQSFLMESQSPGTFSFLINSPKLSK